MESVKACADKVRSKLKSIDIVINNAGVMMTPQVSTSDGHELQLATNHLGHFYLNSLIFDLINPQSGRVVVISSLAHKIGEINFKDIMLKKEYTPLKAYSQSKLANLMYAFELNKRLSASGSNISCIACHPGYSDTNLQTSGPVGLSKFIMKYANKLLAQSPLRGAYPSVLCAAGVEAFAGAYYGPQSFGEYRGRISDASVAEHALDEVAWEKLWRKSEELVGCKFLS